MGPGVKVAVLATLNTRPHLRERIPSGKRWVRGVALGPTPPDFRRRSEAAGGEALLTRRSA